MKPRHVFVFALGAAVAAALSLGACGYEVPEVVVPPASIDSGGGDAGADVVAPTDAMVADVDDGSCNPNAPFGAPVRIDELVQAGYDERYPRLSPDERIVYYSFGKANGTFSLYSASRASSTGPFGKGTPIAELIGGDLSDVNLTVSADGLVALMSSTRTNGSIYPHVSQIWSMSRATTGAPFSKLTWSDTAFGSQNGDLDPYFVPNAGGLFYYANVSLNETKPHISRHVFSDGGYPNAAGKGFGTGNPAAEDRDPVVTPDDLRIYFASNAGADGGVLPSGGNIWTSTRADAFSDWLSPRIVAELAGFGTYPHPGWISPDACRLYLSSNKSGDEAMYVARRGK